ncbi:MAG: endo-1,4-beta-xylanase [Oscillospiraceae bacterium]|nr:endo-1,4-beta-xylanase [Oscillospiraceae bacterium]
MNPKSKRIITAVVTLAMICSTASAVPGFAEDIQTDSDIIFATGFEDGEGIEKFSGRGENEVLTVTDEVVYSGSSAMCVSERVKSWNGPQLRLDDICEPGTEYMVSACVKSQWYSQINLSMQYTDSEGTTHYSNVKTISGDQWAVFKDVKVSFTSDMTDVYVYFEASDANTKMYVDDFELKAAPSIPIEQNIPSLSSVYSDYFKIGTAITPSNMSSKPFMDLVKKHFSSSITLGNEMKPDSMLNKAASLSYLDETGDDTNPQVTLSAAKSVLDYCRDNNISVRGHCLVWHSQTPDWFFKENYSDDGEWVSKEKMTQRMENYIKNVFELVEKEYPTVDFYAWDVVNEAWTDDGKPRTAGSNNTRSGNSAWVQIYGDNSFIEYAFKFARMYAPKNCELFYNDYNEYMPQKTQAICDMAEDLKGKGYIDGIGMQAHLDVGFPTASAFEKALSKFAATGLDVQITELDITTSDKTEAGLQKQAQVYSDIMDAAVKYADNISAVVLWGVTDDLSWRADRIPLLFDSDFKAKPAFYSIVDGLEVPDVTTAESTVTQLSVTTTSATASEPAVTTTVSAAEPENTQTSVTPIRIYGDLNNDSVVELTDLTLMSLYVLGDIKLDEETLKYADVTDDTKVNLADLSHLKQYICMEKVILGPQN